MGTVVIDALFGRYRSLGVQPDKAQSLAELRKVAQGVPRYMAESAKTREDLGVLASLLSDDHQEDESLGGHVVTRVARKARAFLCKKDGLAKMAADELTRHIAEQIRKDLFAKANSEFVAYVIAGAAVAIAKQGLELYCATLDPAASQSSAAGSQI